MVGEVTCCSERSAKGVGGRLFFRRIPDVPSFTIDDCAEVFMGGLRLDDDENDDGPADKV